MAKTITLHVRGTDVTFATKNNSDYLSLTDMARYKDAERTNYVIQNWLRTRSAIEFCGLWEQLNNHHFKSIEFDAFKKRSGAFLTLSISIGLERKQRKTVSRFLRSAAAKI